MKACSLLVLPGEQSFAGRAERVFSFNHEIMAKHV